MRLTDAELVEIAAGVPRASGLASRLATELLELRAALKPFVIGSAEMEAILWGHLPDDTTGTVTTSLADFRRARKALETP
jgi:hypothetical protein